VEAEICIGQLIQIDNGPLLSFEDNRAPEAQPLARPDDATPLGDLR